MAYRASGGQLTVSRRYGQPLILNRLTNDGILIDLRRQGGQKATIGFNLQIIYILVVPKQVMQDYFLAQILYSHLM